MPVIKEDTNDSDGEEMDQDTPDSEKSSNEDSESSAGSDDDDSSEMDEVECERRRTECLYDMADLERQFSLLKEQLYRERMTQVQLKLDEVKSGRAIEYLQPLEELKQNIKIRTEVAEVLKALKLNNINNKHCAEILASQQHYESEKMIVRDMIQGELEEKIRRLEEDRNSIDITSDLKNEQASFKKNKRKVDPMNPDKRKKPVTVSGPYIVYMLHDSEILEDWTAIKKALKASKRKSEYAFRTEENRYSARFADGKLVYEGESFGKGHHIIIENKEESPLLLATNCQQLIVEGIKCIDLATAVYSAHIMALNTSEVILKRLDGNRLKLSISDLQVGKYTIRQCPA